MSETGSGVIRLIRTWSVAAVVAVAFLVLGAPSAGAAEAQGCTGSGVSVDGEGRRLDAAAAPGRGGTKANPFDVTADGEVRYEYDVSEPVAGGRWKVRIDTGLFPVGFSGDVGDSAAQSGDGVEPLEEHLKVGGFSPLVGLIKVDIEATGPGGGTCVVSGWIRIHESVFTTPAFYVALLLALLAIWGFFAAMGSAL